MGCPVMLTWEDIVEVRPRMLHHLVAAIMARALGGYGQKTEKPAMMGGLFGGSGGGGAPSALADCLRKCLPQDGPAQDGPAAQPGRVAAADAANRATEASAGYAAGLVSKEEALAAEEEAMAHGGGDELFKAWYPSHRHRRP